jgi:hypothetical protein
MGTMRSSDKRKGKKTSPLREVFSFEGGTALIERIKYRFGTTHSGRRVHILYRLARNPYTTLCRSYAHKVKLAKSLTIHDIDCRYCRKTLTYFRLLPKGQFKNIEARAPDAVANENANANMRSETRTPSLSGLTPGVEWALFGGKTRTRPKPVFDSDEEIRCVFITLVVKVESLRKKYRGGIGKFLERYGARCNRKLAYLCTMGGEDLDEPIMDLQMNGLTFGDDFICFDAANRALGIELTKDFDKDVSENISFPVEWLRGRVHKGGILVSFVEKMKEAKRQ